MKKTLVIVAVLCIALTGMSCTSNLTKLNEDGVYSRTSTAHTGTITPDGTLQASYYGLGATQLNQDQEGNYAIMPGPVGVLSAPLPTGGVGYIISPKDTRIARIEYTPNPIEGQPSIVIEGIEANISTPLAQHVLGLEIALKALENMTATEALATVEKWKVAGDITSDLAKVIVQAIALW